MTAEHRKVLIRIADRLEEETTMLQGVSDILQAGDAETITEDAQTMLGRTVEAQVGQLRKHRDIILEIIEEDRVLDVEG